jgi:hypothetical protein
VATCGGMWRRIGSPLTKFYQILAGERLPKLDDLKVAGILAAGWLLASWLRMLMNGEW